MPSMGYLCGKVPRDPCGSAALTGHPSTNTPRRTHQTETATVTTNQAARPGRVLTQRLRRAPI